MTKRPRIWMLVFFFATLAFVGLGNHVFQSTSAGRGFSESLWGLNLLHYSEILDRVSRDEGLIFEKRLLEESPNSPLALPTLSHPSGLYPDGLAIEVKLPPGSIGYFTLDGSVPTKRHFRVEGPIEIEDTTVLRIRAFRGHDISQTVTKEYFVSDLEDVAFASLVTDPIHLFNRHAGIYANPEQKGRGWERPALFTILGSSASNPVQLDTRIRIHGGASRGVSNRGRKSFRLIMFEQDSALRKWLGDTADTISPRQTEWILRHAGNERQLWSDRFNLRIASQLGLACVTARPVVLHVNGTGWGVYDLVERMNVEFVSGKEQGQEHTLLHGTPLINPLNQSSRYSNWNQLYTFIVENDLSDDRVFEYVESQIDIDSTIDYFALSIFMADTDRPQNNIDIYRAEKDRHGSASKWKFAVWDFDGGLNYRGIFTKHDTLAWHLRDSVRADLKAVGSPDNDQMVSATRLLRALMRNRGFQDRFRNRFSTLLETTFSSDNLLATFEEMLDDYAAVVPIEQQRLDGSDPWLLEGRVSLYYGEAETDFSYEDRMAEIYSFIAERPGVVKQLLEKNL